MALRKSTAGDKEGRRKNWLEYKWGKGKKVEGGERRKTSKGRGSMLDCHSL